jgi:ribonucleoside-diphosphate reductase alpha chain
VFRLEDIDVPSQFSQVAADILAQKYFRKAGVPAALKKVEENSVPSWLWRSVADEKALAKLPEDERYGSETDARQVFDRLAGTWTYWGWKGGYFDGEADARAFFDELLLHARHPARRAELAAMVQHRPALGLRHRRPRPGPFLCRPFTGKLKKSDSAYEHPQPHACFIQSVGDDLVNDGGIMDLWVREARLFKYGSGTGSNFSEAARRGRKAVRRRQVVGPDELPEDRRPRRRRHQVGRHHAPRRQDGRRRHRPPGYRAVHRLEGQRGAEGRRPRHRLQDRPKHMTAVMKACVNCEADDDCFDPKLNPALKREIKAAKKAMVPENYIKRVIQFARQGYTEIEFKTYDTDWDSEAYLTVSGQNSNNSISVKDEFLRAVESDGEWNLINRRDGKVAKTVKAKELWERVGYAAWASADPGIHFNTTMNDWHTCPAEGRSARPTRARNTCSSTTRPATWPR